MNGVADTRHQAVLLEEVASFLGVESSSEGRAPLLLDCTLGACGHSRRLLQDNKQMLAVGFDCDKEAVDKAAQRLGDCAARSFVVHGNFRDSADLLRVHEGVIRERFSLDSSEELRFDRALLDLGYSSDQMDSAERGLSFQLDGPLDMRLDRDSAKTAGDILNNSDAPELLRIFRRGGVGKSSKKLTRAVLNKRPFKSTREFAELCRSVLGVDQMRRAQTTGSAKQHHPATVPFQALRIAVNDELAALNSFLEIAPTLFRPSGRLAVISFHSLEDKAVAAAMRAWSRPSVPAGLPVRGDLTETALGKLQTKEAVVPSDDEMNSNPRARSARMRVFQFN